jgi:hypothetical protein
MTLTDFVDAIADGLRCSCSTIEDMMEAEDVDFEVCDVEVALADRHNLERCAGCDWWLDAGDLYCDDDEWCGYCADCRPEDKEEKTDA